VHTATSSIVFSESRISSCVCSPTTIVPFKVHPSRESWPCPKRSAHPELQSISPLTETSTTGDQHHLALST
jgi:hypothetical protein